MKNLFDYATKELSQDAFLRWVIDNYDVGKQLVAEMVNLYEGYHVKPNQIDIIKTYGQVQKMDIVVDFKIDGEDCVLIIEDKTTSSEHSNQLKTYKTKVESWNEDYKKDNGKDRQSFFVFYKTHKIDEDERERIKDAGWIEFPFKKINEFWSRHKDHSNFLISQYVQHVTEAWNNSENTKLPSDDNVDKWIGYFNKTLKQKINSQCDIWVSSTYYGYAYFCLRPKGRINESIPYFEIRSLDCLNGNLIGRILLYDVKISDGEKTKYKEKINAKCRLFESENNAQQISSTKKKLKWATEDEYVRLVNDLVKEYLSIFEE